MLTNLIPGVAALKAIAVSAAAGALIIGGAWLGWQTRAMGDPKRIAEGARPICEAAAAQAQLEALKTAITSERMTLEEREATLAQLGVDIDKMRRAQQERTDATPIDVRARECVPSGTPWLRR